MNYDLPKSVSIGDKEYAIRYDFRVILDILEVLHDDELTGVEKADTVLQMFYLEKPDNVREALERCYDFIDCSKRKPKKKSPRLIDWESDFELIIAPVNRVLGYEARSVVYDYKENTGGLHWWTFVAAYSEIGNDCLLSHIVTIRDKQARKKKLDKAETEWLKRNRHLVDLPSRYTEADEELLRRFTGGG